MESKQIELTGRIVLINQEQTFSEKFKKREFVIETPEEYPQSIIMEMVNDKCRLLDSFQIGQEVTVKINLRGRKWINPEGVEKYFNTIQAWQIFESIGSEKVAPIGNIESNFQEDAINQLNNEFEDDLPF